MQISCHISGWSREVLFKRSAESVKESLEVQRIFSAFLRTEISYMLHIHRYEERVISFFRIASHSL